MKNKKGFTLVELLVVIAIIGILSTVAVVNLNSARGKARVASVQGNLAGIVPAVVLCNDDGEQIQADGTLLCGGVTYIVPDTPVAETTLCATGGVWPVLPTGWSYENTCTHNPNTGVFTYSAVNSDTVPITVTCDQDGCRKDPV